MALFAIAILSTWTAVSNYGWERQVDQETGESFGSCGKMQTGWIVAAACLMIVSTLLALIMSWKTKDVDESFSEAWWIFALIFVQLQVSPGK